MNEFVTKWVAALRSGEYEQGNGLLCNLQYREPKYCCWGVAYELTDIPKHIKENDCIQYESDIYGPGYKMLNLCGLSDDTAEELAYLNDNGVSFSDIADLIEKGADAISSARYNFQLSKTVSSEWMDLPAQQSL